MNVIKILLEVHSDGRRTPEELADIAAGRLTSCYGIDQNIQEPVKVVAVVGNLPEHQRAELSVWDDEEGYGLAWNEFVRVSKERATRASRPYKSPLNHFFDELQRAQRQPDNYAGLTQR